MDSPDVEMTDEEIVVQVQGNNEAAMGVLMDRYQPRLLRYGHRFLSDNDHIEDIVQDVFIKAYQNINSFDASRKFSPWIYRIAHNTFVNAIRSKHREPFTFMDLDTLVMHPVYEYDPAEEQEKKSIKALVESGLEMIPELYKEILILYYIEELSYQEIADILHVPMGTVSVRIRRGKEALKKKLQHKWI